MQLGAEGIPAIRVLTIAGVPTMTLVPESTITVFKELVLSPRVTDVALRVHQALRETG